MNKIVLCRLVSIKLSDLTDMMILGRIYSHIGGKLKLIKYSHSEARQLHACIKQGSERKVYIRTDGIC